MTPEHLQRVVDRYQADRRLPSLVVGVLEHFGLAWTGYAGHPTSADTQYRIGSITKVMTSVLVVQARDDGLLDLDDLLGQHLPGTAYGETTVRSLLAHVSGLPSEPAGPWWERSPGGSVEDLLGANSETVSGPHEHYHYSNLGYGLLGALVARLRDEPWRDLVQQRVLDPLGMTRTSYAPQPPYADGFSVHHLAGTLTPEPAHDTGAMAPAGQLWSTIEDLGTFATFLAQGHPGVLAEESWREMRRPVAPASDYGLGVRLVPWAGGMLAGHTGSMPGFQATAFADPLTGAGVVALTNGTTGFNGPELALALLGDRTPGASEPWVPTSSVPEWAAELLGWWFWGNSAYEVRWSGDRLEWRDLARSALAETFERDGDRVVGTGGYHLGETLHVVRREDGSVLRLECATFLYTREPYPDGP